jgi:hypothetical protein
MDSVAQLRAEVRAEFVSLRAEMVAQQELQREVVGQVLGSFNTGAFADSGLLFRPTIPSTMPQPMHLMSAILVL